MPTRLTDEELERDDGPFGERYGHMIVLQNLGVVNRARRVLARCDCGTEKAVRYVSLRSGHTKTCGCGTAFHGVIPEDAFWARVDKTGRCWLWTGRKDVNGYGDILFKGRRSLVHRVAWMLLRGEIPEAMTIDHLCMNKACVNPDHLEVVTRGENARRHTFSKPMRGVK